jgi:hypothetical protein
MKIQDILNEMQTWITNEETKLLAKLQRPILLNHLNAHDQVRVQIMIRKNLVKKIGTINPTVVANEKTS